MTTVGTKSEACGAQRSEPKLNRRTTFMLAVASAVGIATQLRRASAETRTLKVDGTTPAVPQLQNLKTVGPQGQVTIIHHHRDTIEVTTADGRSAVFREADLQIQDQFDRSRPADGQAGYPARRHDGRPRYGVLRGTGGDRYADQTSELTHDLLKLA